MNDFKIIEEKVLNFREQRNWKQFHQIKDLLLGLNIEVGELQELFLWKNTEQIKEVSNEKIEEEIADIGIFLIYICEYFHIDLIDAIDKKLIKNNNKYPIEKSFNSNKKYTEL